MAVKLPCFKKMKHDDEENRRDRISELPSDVLIKILSFLRPEEALLKTRFLSHTWEQLWEFWPCILSFKAWITVCSRGGVCAKTYDDFVNGKFMTYDVKRDSRKFVRWVNNVLISHQGPTIEELRVHFYLHDDCSWHYIDKWIEIAMRKKVKTIQLDFPKDINGPRYRFPQQCFSGIEYLIGLCLKHVSVSDETMGWILSNCPMLETLHVEHSPFLVNLNVSGSSLRLKHLHISFCLSIRSIKISAPNLVSYHHHHHGLFYPVSKVSLHMRYAPKLTELYFCESLCLRSSVEYLVRRLSNYLPQIVTLSLSMIRLNKDDLLTFPRCTSLRHLNCKVDLDHRILLTFKSLIEASPFLHKLKLEIYNRNKIKNELPKVEGHPNEYLKEVEIVGFLGQPIEGEFVKYLLKSAINLEKIVIHIRYTENLQSMDAEERRQMEQKVARKLMKYRPGAKLVLR